MKNTGSDETMLVPGLGLVGLFLFYSAVLLRCYDMNGCHQWVSSSSLGVSDETPSSVAMMAALGMIYFSPHSNLSRFRFNLDEGLISSTLATKPPWFSEDCIYHI